MYCAMNLSHKRAIYFCGQYELILQSSSFLPLISSLDMCCSGMPTPDEKHAQNIANFAIAVSECVHLITSPSDGEPLQLRIGIHTGHCMGGVVGTG